ncbi:MAG: hypothetical protein V3W41_03250 [Planctomycetota bacterium]
MSSIPRPITLRGARATAAWLAVLMVLGMGAQGAYSQSFKGFSLPHRTVGSLERKSAADLLRTLRKSHPEAITLAALELARRRDPHTLAALIAAVERSTGRSREDLIIALGLLGDPGARPYLEALACQRAFAGAWLNDRAASADPALRAAAALGLGFLSAASDAKSEALRELVLDPAGQAAEVHLAACIAIGLRAAANEARRDPLLELSSKTHDVDVAGSREAQGQVAILVRLARSEKVQVHSRVALLISLAQAFPRYEIVQQLVKHELAKGRPELSLAARDAKNLIERALRAKSRRVLRRSSRGVLARSRSLSSQPPESLRQRELRAQVLRRQHELKALHGVIVCLRRSGQTGKLTRLLKTAARGTNPKRP